MRKLLLVGVAGLQLALALPAVAVNDPAVPGDDCSASGTAVGHPAFVNNQTPLFAANPPFSANNPGVSEGAQGSANSHAIGNCKATRP
jgi:hypothetical protein